jgi:hypothetical protein
MPRKPAPRPDDPPEWAAGAVRFAFGAAFGLFLAAGSFFFVSLSHWYWIAAIAAACALVCGFLAMKYGDGFWESLSGWLRWW